MNAWKRWLASALSAVMLFSLIPAPAFAGMLETNEETASVAESVTGAESENGKASVTEIERDEAELNSAADDIYEVGYRFSEETPWTIVGADKDKSRRDANYRLFAQDGENFNYAIDLAEAFPTREDVKFPLEVYLIVWDAAGKSEELKNGDELYKFDDETDKISILNTNYSLSVYADWLEEFYYQAGDREESKVTADQDWRNAHSKEYEDSADGIAVNLTRMETLPFALKFRVPDGASPLTFSNPSPDGAVETEGQTVTFLTQDASVTVSYKHETNGKEIVSESVFSVHDPYYGEVAYTLNENEENYELDEEPDKNWITFGSDADWAKEYPDNYKTATEETLSLGDDDSFPFRVRFYMRGVSDPAKAFSDETGVQRDENSFVAFFQKKGASLKVGDYAFTTEDLRAGEVRYSAAHIGAKILTRDKNWAESHQRSYIYKEPSDNAHIIRLTEYNTFPVEVTFSLPRDKVSELEFSGTDVTVGKVEAQERNADGSYPLSFKEKDASVTFAGYTFTVHSPFEGAVRCEIVGSGRKLIVGANNEANAVYAKELQDAADKGTKERWKSEPDGYVERTRPNYILFGSEQTVIELKEGEYFPCTVKFTRWEPDKGWDEDNADTQVFNSVKEASGADTIITAFKDTNFARQFAIHADWLDEVKYQLPGQSAVIVCNDAEKAAALSHYELFGGKDFAINPNNSIVFPCVVTFTVRNASGSETVAEENFENSDAEAEIRGHTFKIRLAWKGEVVYTLDPNGPFETVKTVGKSDAVGDEAWTWAQTHSDYDIATKSEDGRFFYTIKQEGRLAFPLKVAFQMRDSSNKAEVEFKNLEDTHKYNGITFSIHPEWLDTVEYTLVREVKQDNGDVQTKTLTVEVGTDEEEAKAAKEAAEAAFENATEEQRKNNPFLGLPSYRLSDDDAGNVKIELEDDAFFPYGIQFSYTRLEKSGDNLTPKAVPNENSSGVVWFEGAGEDYAQTVGGYTFYVVTNRTDPAKLVSAGLRINAVKD
ncbi:MAG: hypothetical protein IJQ81_00985, partial [Oscillibacter sp.]|nr:hypothetical protein [Oscillibacter sp.]